MRRRLALAWAVFRASHYVVITERINAAAFCDNEDCKQDMLNEIDKNILRIKYRRDN